VPAAKVLSSGFVRRQNLNLRNVVVMPTGGTTASASPAHALQMRAAESYGTSALAVAEAHVHVHEHQDEHVHVHAAPALMELDRRTEARMKGYEGDSCNECGNYTMVRNGTCLKCDTCGSTSGCS
jgi:ribonucleoside-diphosphate reductase alpha chain